MNTGYNTDGDVGMNKPLPQRLVRGLRHCVDDGHSVDDGDDDYTKNVRPQQRHYAGDADDGEVGGDYGKENERLQPQRHY